MADGALHRLGWHWQGGVNNPGGPGEVAHTDYVHPVYGYSRFDGHVNEHYADHLARLSYERSLRARGRT